jgi:hypothetical protein
MSEREIPPILIEQLELGELSPARRVAVEAELARVAIDPREALRASNAEILTDYPSERVMTEVRRRASLQTAPPRPRSRAWLPWMVVPGLAGAAALVWVVMTGGFERGETESGVGPIAQLDSGSDEGEPTRIKGGAEAHLVVDRKLGEGHERLVAGELIREGDLVQISVVPEGHTQGVILSIDGRGVVTLHHPSTPDAPALLPAGAEIPLASSYQLDDAPEFERFILVTRSDDAAIDVGAVMAAAERLASDPKRARTAPLELVGEVWQQRSLELRKPTPLGDLR